MTEQKTIIRHKIELYFGLISTLLIPINKQWVIFSLLGWFIITLGNLALDLIQKQKIRIKTTSVLPILALPLFYLLHLVGMSYSSNIDYGLFDLEIKFSMLIIPIILLLRINVHKGSEKQYFLFLISGCTISMFVNISQAIAAYLIDGNSSHFFYAALSPDIHPSYLAFYIGIGLLAILNYRNTLLSLNKNTSLLILIPIFIALTTYLMMLSSKAGIISFALALAVYASIRLAQKMKLRNAVVLGIGIFTLPFFLIQFIPSVNMRFLEMRKALSFTSESSIDSQSGTIARLAIIKSGWNMSVENLPFGVGTGDIKDEITRFYLSKGSKTISTHYLNAHNQFAQSTIALGIPGLIFILLLYILGFQMAYRKRSLLFASLLILMLIQMLFESMLEQQAGVIFITLFYSLFCIWDENILNNRA